MALVRIALTNYSSASTVTHVVIDVLNHRCLLDDGRQMDKASFLQNVEFAHPLFQASYPLPHNGQVYFEYEDIDGLLNVSVSLYAALLQMDDPSAYRFIIRPSSNYRILDFPKSLYFSASSRKKAATLVSVEKLNGMLSHLYGDVFQFSNDVLIIEELTINDLPKWIDGEELYQKNDSFMPFITSVGDVHAYELRYVSPMVGFGVFSRDTIKKGTCLSVYGGVKKIERPGSVDYMFEIKKDCLNMHVDAEKMGNLMRFINHAPTNDSKIVNTKNSKIAFANVVASGHCLQGIEFIFYRTLRDIRPGEQLLVNYGKRYFKPSEIAYFKSNGTLQWSFRSMSHSFVKTKHISIMAHHGVEQARHYMFKRSIILSLLIIVLVSLIYFLD